MCCNLLLQRTAEVAVRARPVITDHHWYTGGDAERFKEINTAYEVLRDPEKRRIYDEVCGHIPLSVGSLVQLKCCSPLVCLLSSTDQPLTVHSMVRMPSRRAWEAAVEVRVEWRAFSKCLEAVLVQGRKRGGGECDSSPEGQSRGHVQGSNQVKAPSVSTNPPLKSTPTSVCLKCQSVAGSFRCRGTHSASYAVELEPSQAESTSAR